jgi:hypothetical protein
MSRAGLNSAFHALLSDLKKTTEQKKQMVQLVSTQRASSSAELTDKELERLVYGLRAEKNAKRYEPDSPESRMIRKLYALARQLGWHISDGRGGTKVHAARINSWCLKHTTAHKPLEYMNVKELAQAITAMEKYVASDTLKNAR